jgi:REP element-mobilizing transposase RayT
VAFHIDAWVVLPDHRHCVWTLPPDEDDFTNHWRLIKQRFSKGLSNGERRSAVRIARGERGIWQHRSWEYAIRDEADYTAHVDYCHINPVKQGLSNGRWTGRIPPFTVTLNRVVIHWIGLADPTSMFREAKAVDSQISHAAQYASTLSRPTRATAAGLDGSVGVSDIAFITVIAVNI